MIALTLLTVAEEMSELRQRVDSSVTLRDVRRHNLRDSSTASIRPRERISLQSAVLMCSKRARNDLWSVSGGMKFGGMITCFFAEIAIAQRFPAIAPCEERAHNPDLVKG